MPSRCAKTGTRASVCTRSTRLRPPRGMTTSRLPARPFSISPTAARSATGTSWMASSGRPAALRPSTRQAWMACDEFSESEPPRRITAVAGLEAQRAGIGRHIGPAFVDHTDDTQRRAHAFDVQAVGAVPGGGHFAHGVFQCRRWRARRRPLREYAPASASTGPASPATVLLPRHSPCRWRWRRGFSARCAGSRRPWRPARHVCVQPGQPPADAWQRAPCGRSRPSGSRYRRCRVELWSASRYLSDKSRFIYTSQACSAMCQACSAKQRRGAEQKIDGDEDDVEKDADEGGQPTAATSHALEGE